MDLSTKRRNIYKRVFLSVLVLTMFFIVALVLKSFIVRLLCMFNYDRLSDLHFSDVNECTEKLHDCSTAAACTNTEGSFACHCDPGYSGNGTTCAGMLFVNNFCNLYLNGHYEFVSLNFTVLRYLLSKTFSSFCDKQYSVLQVVRQIYMAVF